jgi:hypothetical protein
MAYFRLRLVEKQVLFFYAEGSAILLFNRFETQWHKNTGQHRDDMHPTPKQGSRYAPNVIFLTGGKEIILLSTFQNHIPKYVRFI